MKKKVKDRLKALEDRVAEIEARLAPITKFVGGDIPCAVNSASPTQGEKTPLVTPPGLASGDSED